MKAVSCRDEDLDLGGEEIFESYIKVASAMTVVQLLNKAHCPSGAAAGPGWRLMQPELSNPLLSSCCGHGLGLVDLFLNTIVA